MEQNSLFPFKYRLRKTDELVEVIAWETSDKGARNENDWVSYIDSAGNEHIREHLTLELDFKIDNPLEKAFEYKPLDLPKLDLWETRRYELSKEFLLHGLADCAGAVEMADSLIEELKKEPNKGL